MRDRFELAWHPNAHWEKENRFLGLTAARLMGIRKAHAPLLVFVDDDNVLEPDYLEVAYQISEERSDIGAWSGQSIPEFDTEPSAWTRRYWRILATRIFEDDRWSNLPRCPDTIPYGAGLCVRKEVGRHYLHLHESGQRRTLLDRKGESLLSGGDHDMAACATELGMGVGIFSKLKLKHLIPEWRLSPDYLARLAYGVHYSSVVLDMYWLGDSGVTRRTRKRKLVNLFRAFLMKSADRRIFRAANRGEEDAVRDLDAKRV